MASLCLTPNSLPPSFLIPSHANPRQRLTNNARRLVPRRATSDGQGETPTPRPTEKFDRRDVLFGLGGLAGIGSGSAASAAPIQAPTQADCHHPTDLPTGVDIECCPPKSKIDKQKFKPTFTGKLRVRQAAQNITPENLEKFKMAIQLMKELPDDDPRSFIQQANVHCAYCNDAYYQVGYEAQKINIQVHSSWLFFPFHRWELFFFEKILGKLINDDNFAMPFWNWDNIPGMYMPAIYADPTSPLYDQQRNRRHLPPVVTDLEYKENLEYELPPEQQIAKNLSTMYRQMVLPNTPELFMGASYVAGQAPSPGYGALENTPHNKLHTWGGNPNNPNDENLGNFYSAGNDPLFYALHGNVDRLWNIWKTLPGGDRRDFQSSDWQNATYAFYNEDQKLVEVSNRDCVDSADLGYTYEDLPLPWLNAKPVSFIKKKLGAVLKKRTPGKEKVLLSPSDFPLTLDKPVSVVVPRPKKRRSKAEKEFQVEVLKIEGIEYDKAVTVSFEVYLNDEDETDKIGPESSEFLTTFSSVASGKSSENKGIKAATSVKLPITEALEDLDAEDDDTVIISLVPKTAIGRAKIGGIKIDLFKIKIN